MSDRRDAARALGRVMRRGAWSNIVLRDGSGRARALLLDTLRTLPSVDGLIERASGRPTSSIDEDLLDLLRVATTELDGRGDRPAPVIVDGAVRDAGSLSGKYRGFANAVLRRIAEATPGGPVRSPADRGIPDFVHREVTSVLGEEDATRLWEALDRPARVGIRSVAPIPGAEAVPGVSGAWLWTGGPPPEGAVVQDPASVAVVTSLGVEPGMTVVDLAAAPGGKAAHVVELVGPEGLVVAVDVHRRRAATGAHRTPRAQWVVGDGRRPPLRSGLFDRVLLDAPCSGLGTLRRRPEIRYRVNKEGVEELAAMQTDLLDRALDLLAPGGRLVYSVCTVLPAETSGIVAGRGGRAPEGLPGRPWGEGWMMSPDRAPTDGMFVWVFDSTGRPDPGTGGSGR